MKSKWPTRLLTVLVLPLVSVGFACGLSEVALRIAGYEAIYEIYSKPWQFWEHDELLGWRHTPGATDEFVGPRPWPIEFRAQVSINSLGLRGPEVPERRPDELRVLAIGDSMVAAFEVEWEETFVARLQGALADLLEQPVTTINAGVRGYGTDQALLYFRERGSKLDPDFVVFFHSGNDVTDNTTLHEMRRPYGKAALALREGGELELVGAPVPLYPACSEYVLSSDFEVVRRDTWIGRVNCGIQKELFSRSALLSFITIAVPWDVSTLRRLYYLGNPHGEQLAKRKDPSFGYAHRLTMATLLELAKEVERRGAGFLVIGAPQHLAALDSERLATHRVQTFALEEIAKRPRGELTWKHDSHLNPEGHRLLASLLADRIAQQIGEESTRHTDGFADSAL